MSPVPLSQPYLSGPQFNNYAPVHAPTVRLVRDGSQRTSRSRFADTSYAASSEMGYTPYSPSVAPLYAATPAIYSNHLGYKYDDRSRRRRRHSLSTSSSSISTSYPSRRSRRDSEPSPYADYLPVAYVINDNEDGRPVLVDTRVPSYSSTSTFNPLPCDICPPIESRQRELLVPDEDWSIRGRANRPVSPYVHRRYAAHGYRSSRRRSGILSWLKRLFH
jgi:hypothetical protein